jgi:hypothetical protein
LVGLALVTALCGLVSRSVRADSPASQQALTPQAQTHYDTAGRYFMTQSYASAIKEFQKAYALDPQASILYSIAQAQRLNSDCKDAISTYQRYLHDAGAPTNDVDAAKQSNAKDMLSTCQEQVGPVTRPTPPKPTPKPPGPTPTPPKPPRPTPPPPAPEGPSWYSDGLGLSLLGGGAALVAGGVGLFAYGTSQANSAHSLKEVEFSSQYSGAGSTRTIGLALGVAGGLAMVGGITRLLLVSGDSAEQDKGTRAAIVPGGVVVMGTF